MAHPLIYLGAALLGGLAAAALDYYMPDRDFTLGGVTFEAGAIAAGLALVAGAALGLPLVFALGIGSGAFEAGKIGGAHLLPAAPPAGQLPPGPGADKGAAVAGVDYDDIDTDEVLSAFNELEAA